jgi:hypothetical protein
MNPSPERENRSMRRAWPGILLILLGVLFLARQYLQFSLNNWWALFILIPAIGSFWTASSLLARGHGLDYAVRGSLISGIIVLAVALMFLLELSWGVFWPLFVILPGLALVFGGRSGQGRPWGERICLDWMRWIGLSVTLLGLTFLLRNLGVFHPEIFLHNWWGVFVLLPALGGMVITLQLLFAGEGLGWMLVGNLIPTFIFALLGVFTLLGVNWNMLTPLLLIGVGLLLVLRFLGDRREQSQ